jgi:hypothetical protein
MLLGVASEPAAADILAGAALARHRIDAHPCPICGLARDHPPETCPNRAAHPIEASAFDLVRWDN